MAGGDTKHIVQSLFANLAIACAKGVAAFFTGSGALMAETIHSAADCSNQALLLMGVKRAQKPADEAHPMGYGRELYFWSFIVALLLFSGGGMFSLYEGIHKIQHPEPLDHVWVGVVILIFSILIEGGATISNIKELNKRRGETPFFKFLRDTKDSDLVVVFGENSAATVGLVLALAALGVSYATGDTRWDAIGTMAIGVVLIGVAVFLAVEIKGLLLGEAADPAIAKEARRLVAEHERIEELLNLITVQQGPGEVMVAMKVRLAKGLTTDEVVATINQLERSLRKARPEVRWSFVEPDVLEEQAEVAAADAASS